MRSRLEAWHAERLDAQGEQWRYEPFCFAGLRGQYLPDFLLVSPDGENIYQEVKGDMPDPLPVMEQMEVIWESDPEAMLLLIHGKGGAAWHGFKDPVEDAFRWFDNDDFTVVREIPCRAF